MIYLAEPDVFDSRFDVVSCCIESQWQILLLHRQDHKPQGNTRCLPAGKVDAGEDLLNAIIRESFEETGIRLNPEDISYVKKVYIKYSDFDFVYHIFLTQLDASPEVVLSSSEHKDFVRVNPKDALIMELIEDEDKCIKLVYGI